MMINPIPGLKREPVQIVSEWKSKIVTTDPPIYIPHNEYSLVYKIDSEQLFLAVLLFEMENRLMYQRFWRSASNYSLNVSISFHPHNWKYSDAVSIGYSQEVKNKSAGIHLNIVDPQVKNDPRGSVINQFDYPHSMATGTKVLLATLDTKPAIELSILLVLKEDTRATHGRWHVKPSIYESLPKSMAFLRHGRCTGSVSTESRQIRDH